MPKALSAKYFDIINLSLLFLVGVVTFYPFYLIFIQSISNPMDVIKGDVLLLPTHITFVNYMTIFKQSNIWHAAYISTARTVIGTILTVFCCAMFAYGLSKEILPFRKLMYRMVVVTMYISPNLIPWYITMKSLHLTNNFMAYILPLIIVPFYVILIKTYFEQLPPALEESAMIDGARYIDIFFRIILPLSAPILATVAIFQAVTHWNSWVDNFFLNPASRFQTLQLLLLTFLNDQSAASHATDSNYLSKIKVTPTSIRMTITMIVVLPIFIVYPFLQRFFVKGIMLGAVKG
ncbi:carbohydrate ABC transporter permease [Paenibacillus psychroresistens]|uniref:Carbohydrate ABC transporter permease n=1 Tax=Paenibacillus psychroresistens TaxID=1778678 RepID=A0A6B8RRR9_9BACL|nr:carbohydrate ABC transporter permease [Paenibacillus psychroresistens]QGQ98504.1 carbohydrate ABC transporter permease [Paenibacillus psychroresistens]